MVVHVRGPSITYGSLKFIPVVESRALSLDIQSFTIRRGNDRYDYQDLPVSQALPETARDDIVLHTFELDEEVRAAYFEIDYEIPSYDECIRVHFRAVEYDGIPDMLFFEVEDPAGDWVSVEDVQLADVLGDSFLRTMECCVMSKLDPHTLDMLPFAAE